MQTTRTTSVQDLAPAARAPAVEADPASALAAVRREAFQLPVLRRGRHRARVDAGTWPAVTLRLQAALWEVAARADVPVAPGASVDEVARILVGHGALIPSAGDAVRVLAAVAESASGAEATDLRVDVREAASLAERLSGYLALRARFG